MINTIEYWQLLDIYEILSKCYPEKSHKDKYNILVEFRDNVKGFKPYMIADITLYHLMSYSKEHYPDLYYYIYERATDTCKRELIDVTEEHKEEVMRGFRKAIEEILRG